MDIEVRVIEDVEIALLDGLWPLPQAMRDSVTDVWAAQLKANPKLWDGRILGVERPEIGADGVLRTRAREDAFSAFLTWREAGCPDVGVFNLFGTALIVSSDGYLIFGRMANDTANAGLVYPPGGSLEPRDVGPDGMVDVKNCIALEMEEETGLRPADARTGALVVVLAGPRIAVCRAYHFALTAEALLVKIRANLDLQEHRELADVLAVRRPVDVRAGVLAPYAAALLDAWQDRRIAL